MPYPVTVDVEPLLTRRNRLTTAFRLILFIQHTILVGGIGFGLAHKSGGSGMTSPQGLFEFGVGSRRWLVRVEAYMLLMIDEYPPFALS
jgi:hypothetical protein